MDDERIKERQKEFIKSNRNLVYLIATIEDLSHQRIEYAAKLRKSKKESLIQEKRMQIYNEGTENTADQEEYTKFITIHNPMLADPLISIVMSEYINLRKQN